MHESPGSPRFTVVVPAWNAEATLARTLDSLLAQTFGDFEAIVVDDGSTDATGHIAARYAESDPRFRVIATPNRGSASALCDAFSQARGEFYVVLDSDDELIPEFFEKALEDADAYPDRDIYGHDMQFVLKDGREWPFFGWSEPRSLTIDDLLSREVIAGAGTVFRPSVIEKTGGYRRELRRVEDQDLWMRALLAGCRHIHIPEVRYRYIQGAPHRKGHAVIAEQTARMSIVRDVLESGKLNEAQTALAHADIAASEEFIERLSRPRFSVVVPAYNAQDTLADTLEGVFEQTYDRWECIVVDDGSTDDTLAVARSFEERDPRFRVVSQENRGTGGAYNTGVAAAVGEWISICSADDRLLPATLAAMSDAIDRNPDHDIFSCNGYLCWSDGNRAVRYMEDANQVEHDTTVAEILDSCFYSVGACYRRTIWEELGGYREDIHGEDYDLWVRAMVAGARHRYIPDRLTLHRISDSQKSASFTSMWESDIDIISRGLAAPGLTREERRAGRHAIRNRKRYIAEHIDPRGISARFWGFEYAFRQQAPAYLARGRRFGGRVYRKVRREVSKLVRRSR